MLISLLAFLLAFATNFYFTSFPIAESAFVMIIGGTVILLAAAISTTLTLLPLERLEQNLVPNLMELFRKDRWLQAGRIWLFLFPLLSYVAAALLYADQFTFKHWIVPAWIFAFGISLDALKEVWKSMLRFLNPLYLVNLFSHAAKKAVQNEKDEALWNSIDNLSEMTLRAIDKSKIALSTQTLQAFPPIIRTFFASSKSISRINIDKETEKATGRDEASYTVFYLIQRLELINDRALQSRLETVCRQMIMVLGKIIIASAKYDLSMVPFPTHFLTKFGLKALQHHFSEVTVLTTSTLQEIARTILTEIDTTYSELQEPFQAIINGLDAIAKATFKKDKSTSIKILVQPFVDLKTLFQTEKMAKHPDAPVILKEIERVIEEFTVLEQVMRSIPPIPELGDMGLASQAPSPDTIAPAS